MKIYHFDMNPIEKLIRQNAAEIVREYTGALTKEEESRIKYDCKTKLPYGLTPRSPGRQPKIKRK